MAHARKTQGQDTQRARAWLKPEQVADLRDAALASGATYLQERNDMIVALLYLPAHKQKDYPDPDHSPPPRYMDIDREVCRDLRRYLDRCWKDPDALLPSRQADRMSTESVRNVLTRLAREVEVRPFLEEGGQGTPSEVSPHTLRHSVAYRMLRREDARLVDVRDRLRHSSIQTTEQIYEHF